MRGVDREMRLRGNRTRQLFRYSRFLLYVCGGRNEYVDRSHVDGSASIRLSSQRAEFLPNLCSMRLECRKKPVPPAVMVKLIRRFLFETSPFLFLSGATPLFSPQRRPISFFFGNPPLFLTVGPLGFPRATNNRSENGNRPNNKPNTFQEDKAIALHFLIYRPV